MASMAYREEREGLLALLERGLAGDPDVVAVWLGGSLGSGRADDFSDIDLCVVVRQERMAGIADAPARFVRGITPTVMEIEAPANAPEGGAYLLTWVAGKSGPQQVDWYWLTESMARRPGNTVILFERHSIPVADPEPLLEDEALAETLAQWFRETLLMAFITTKHILRGSQWDAARHISHLARCSGTIEWLIQRRRMPRPRDPIDVHLLPQDMPADRPTQLRSVRMTLARTVRIIGREHGTIVQDSRVALTQLDLWLDRADRLV